MSTASQQVKGMAEPLATDGSRGVGSGTQAGSQHLAAQGAQVSRVAQDVPLTHFSQRLMRDRQTLLHWIQWCCTLGWVVAALVATSQQQLGAFPIEYTLLAIATAALMAVIYRPLGVFHRYRSLPASLGWLTLAWLLVMGSLVVLLVPAGAADAFDLQALGLWAALAWLGQVTLYLAIHGLSTLWQRRLRVNTPTLVVGTGRAARNLAASINRNPFMPDFVAGIVGDGDLAADAQGEVPVLGGLEKLFELVHARHIDRVYLVLPIERSAEVARLQRQLLDHNVDVIWAPDISGLNPINPGLHELAGMPLIALSQSPLCSGGRALVKSFMDVFLAAFLLLLAAPLFLILSILIKVTSSGPVYFRQPRHGWDGAVFQVWKFRSMYQHEEAAGQVRQATRGDPRITPIGRFMRRTSLDELPQLFNVLNGTMSLVGPRPHAVPHNHEYAGLIGAYMARHRVKPGITGWAQVHGYRGETDSLDKMQQRVRLDLEYINNWSLRMDLWILLRTPFALFCDTAY